MRLPSSEDGHEMSVEKAQSLVMLFSNVGRDGLQKFSLKKSVGQKEAQDP